MGATVHAGNDGNDEGSSSEEDATRSWWQIFKKENMLNKLQVQEKKPVDIMKTYMATRRLQRETSGT